MAMEGLLLLLLLSILSVFLITTISASSEGIHGGEQPLAKIAIHKTILSLRNTATIKASPHLLGQNVMGSSLFLFPFLNLLSLPFQIINSCWCIYIWFLYINFNAFLLSTFVFGLAWTFFIHLLISFSYLFLFC